MVDPAALDVDALQGAGNSEAIALGLMDLELAWQELLQAQTDYNTLKGIWKSPGGIRHGHGG